eukprot:6188820-Pleurochrysis_carterae.AAC.1
MLVAARGPLPRSPSRGLPPPPVAAASRPPLCPLCAGASSPAWPGGRRPPAAVSPRSPPAAPLAAPAGPALC